MFEYRDRNCGTVCCVKLSNNYKIRKPLSARNKQTKGKWTKRNNKTMGIPQTVSTWKFTVDWKGRHSRRYVGVGGGGAYLWDKETSSLRNVYLSKQNTNMPDSIIKPLLLKQFQASESSGMWTNFQVQCENSRLIIKDEESESARGTN